MTMKCQEIYRNEWSTESWNGKKGKEAIADDFAIDPHALDTAEILYASYTEEDYSGVATVVFKQDGKLYIASGSHCSCYGLEGQWEPEEICVEVLERMLASGGSYTFGSSYYDDDEQKAKEAFKAMINRLKSEACA